MLIVLQRGHLIERVPISAFSSILNSRRAHFPQRCSSFIYATQLSVMPPLWGRSDLELSGVGGGDLVDLDPVRERVGARPRLLFPLELPLTDGQIVTKELGC